MKIIPLQDVEKKKVNMEGAQGAWKQLPLGSQTVHQYIPTESSQLNREVTLLTTVIPMNT